MITEEIVLKIYLTFVHNISKVFHEAFYVFEKSDLFINKLRSAVEVFISKILTGMSVGCVGGKTKA
jgi:hypothetical protein